jgi:DNA repair photolyase
MYTWITDTWNTIKGECPHGCSYCYMHRWGKQKPVRFDEQELKTDLGEGKTIFVGSSCDMFAKEIPYRWTQKTLTYLSKYYKNKYLIQTKNPSRIAEFYIDVPFVLCTTIETNRWYPEIMKNCPHPEDRASAMALMSESGIDCYVTIEPILDFDLKDMVELIYLCNPIQVNIGANTSNIKLPEPSKEKVLELINELQKFTIIDQKRNLSRLLK